MIQDIENSETSLVFFVVSFLFIITIRNFLEHISTGVKIDPGIFLHYYLFYVALALLLIWLFGNITGVSYSKTARVILIGFGITLIVPIIDLIFTNGAGIKINYLLPSIHENLGWRFMTLGGNLVDGIGISIGQKIEVILALFFSLGYFYFKKVGILKNILATLSVYIIIFFFAITPFVFKILFSIFRAEEYQFFSRELYAFYYGLIALVFLGLLFFRKYFFVLRDFSLVKVGYYYFFILLGIGLAFSGRKMALDYLGIIDLAAVFIALFFAAIFSAITNNISDVAIDRISHDQRSLVIGRVDEKTYWKIALGSLALALFFASLVDFKGFFLVVLIIGNYFLYSMPPFRIKRILFLSKLPIALNSLVAVLLGYYICSKDLQSFSFAIWPYFLIGITLAANFLDIKDYAGDKVGGIKTLPVVFGLKNSKMIIGLLMFLTYVSFYLLAQDVFGNTIFNKALLLLGVIQAFLINRKKYNENLVLGVIIFSIAIFVVLFLTNNF